VSPDPTSTHVQIDGPASSLSVLHPPLVLVHGVGLDLSMWDLVASDLASDRVVVRYDLWGHGGSLNPVGDLTVSDLVAQCRWVLHEAFSVSGTTPDLVGLSLGGLVGLATAARHSAAVGRLVVMNTTFNRTEEELRGSRDRLALAETEGLEPVASLAIDRWFAPEWQDAHPGRVAMVRDRLASNDLDAYLKAYRLFVDGDPDMPSAASRITSATLALTGELDAGSTPSMSRAIAAAVVNGRSLILSGLRHLPPIEAPEVCLAALREFLDVEVTIGMVEV